MPKIITMRLKQRGIGLLELLLSLSLIAILLILAMRFFTATSHKRNMMDTIETIQAVRSAVGRAMVSNMSLTDVAGCTKTDMLPCMVARNYLPSSSVNAWGGTIAVEALSFNSDEQELRMLSKYSITMDKVPLLSCKRLQTDFNSMGASAICTSANGGTLIVAFVLS